MSWGRFEGVCNDYKWPVDEQFTTLAFVDKSGTNSLTSEGWKTWSENMNQENRGHAVGASFDCATTRVMILLYDPKGSFCDALHKGIDLRRPLSFLSQGERGSQL